ncbi:iron chelate uptake ABC transporter family permease subunit [uncultured Roseovarius sp.]|uniref:ABC transporter permease n=1 Tax=uncultured Roseovarius sp. TaxID=293344 RepID=UPI002609FF64|nr:iron chelate uptake ABC transporter family permease subunit [uncultured Roseovarius sp.]
MRSILILGFGLVVLSIASLFIGVIDLRPGDLWRDRAALELVVVSRGPRLFAILITGAALAVCGKILQMLMKNRFVEPMTVGTGQGAALGILIAAIFFPTAPLLSQMGIAAISALIASLGFIAMARRLPPTQPFLVALVGIVYGGILGAIMVFIAFQADLLQYIDIWLTGEFSGVLQGRYELLWLAALVAALSYLAADQFAIAGMGRAASINLGLNYTQVVLIGLVAISLVTAMTVVTVGMLPFVGLIVPNIVSRLYGDNLRHTLPVVAMMGAGLVLAADILGRVVRYPFEIPVGVVLGVVGAVLFIWLLYRPARYAG